MIIPNTPVAANIVRNNDNQISIKLKRVKRSEGVYDLTVESLCALVDKMSNHKLNEHVDCTYLDLFESYLSSFENSIKKISNFLYKTLSVEEFHNLFGNVEFDCTDDLVSFLRHSPLYTQDSFTDGINNYMNKNYR